MIRVNRTCTRCEHNNRRRLEAVSLHDSAKRSSPRFTGCPFRGEVSGSRRLAIYGIRPFEIQTITLERIFIDKLFAAEAYTRNAGKENRAFEASKHIYDLAILSEQKKIKELLHDPEKMKYLSTLECKKNLIALTVFRACFQRILFSLKPLKIINISKRLIL